MFEGELRLFSPKEEVDEGACDTTTLVRRCGGAVGIGGAEGGRPGREGIMVHNEAILLYFDEMCLDGAPCGPFGK